MFSTASIASLDKAGIPWRVVFSSPSIASHWAAVHAGLGIAMRSSVGMPKSLVALNPDKTGLPRLPTIPLSLYHAESEPSKAVMGLSEILLEMIGLIQKDA
jgi:DNA-binding transcriptional LysR family regulator